MKHRAAPIINVFSIQTWLCLFKVVWKASSKSEEGGGQVWIRTSGVIHKAATVMAQMCPNLFFSSVVSNPLCPSPHTKWTTHIQIIQPREYFHGYAQGMDLNLDVNFHRKAYNSDVWECLPKLMFYVIGRFF